MSDDEKPPASSDRSGEATVQGLAGRPGRCMKCADTRSNRWVGGSHSRMSACSHVVRSAMSAPAAAARSAARSTATVDTSTPVTFHPRAASQIASAPSPLPTSRALPGAHVRDLLDEVRVGSCSHCGRRARRTGNPVAGAATDYGLENV